MSKYLYCASVQGIQDFIFKTNELRHICGASELVEKICTDAFEEFYGCNGDNGIVIKAAGNIKYIFESEEECAKAVRFFPKKVMNMAPGITISQAVCKYDEGATFSDVVDKAEEKLKTQRNKPQPSLTLGLMGTKRANNTGLPVVRIEGNEYLDDATVAKLDAMKKDKHHKNDFGIGKLYKNCIGENVPSEKIAFDIKNLTGKNDWIAIVHADGNGLGKVVQKVGHNEDEFKLFSLNLEKATKAAANEAFKSIKGEIEENATIPLRPVVLGGDDLTVIIRGDLAIKYTAAFISAFEQQTKEKLGEILKKHNVFADGSDYLSACAGIAFTKSSYPFYYGYVLAEELCKEAKKDTKARGNADNGNLPKSCLMFHKVQDTYVRGYEDIVKRELTAKGKLSFKAGPYYISDNNYEGSFTVAKLDELAKRLDTDDKDGLRSGIRRWISDRLKDANVAKQRKDRMSTIFSEKNKKTMKDITDEDHCKCIAYDVLAYHTILNQQTKE